MIAAVFYLEAVPRPLHRSLVELRKLEMKFREDMEAEFVSIYWRIVKERGKDEHRLGSISSDSVAASYLRRGKYRDGGGSEKPSGLQVWLSFWVNPEQRSSPVSAGPCRKIPEMTV